MYNCQHTKILKISVLVLMPLLVALNQTIWFDLTDEVASKFQNYYKDWLSDDYVTSVYSPNFSKDPFWDAISNVEDKHMQLKIAGSQYVERQLSERGCYMSQKKVWSILYYFVPEFRAELARSLKQELWDYDSKKYQIDEDTLIKYCREYYLCDKSQWYSAMDIFKSRNVTDCDKEKTKYDNCRSDCNKQKGDKYNRCISSCESGEWRKYSECLRLLDVHDDYHLWAKISADTTEDIKTNCQEFFQWNYSEWENNEKIMQSVQVVQLWSDRYWNETTDDSPYDIMFDLGIFAKLLYQEAEEPITPVFFDIPNFSNSKKALRETRAADASSSLWWGNWWWGNWWWENWWWENWWWENWWWENWWWGNWWWGNWWWESWLLGNWWWGNTPSPTPIKQEWFSAEWWYDELVEWLNAFSVVNNNSFFYWSLCEDDSQEEKEPESEDGAIDNEESPSVADLRTFSDLSHQEYQDIIDYMLTAVNRYDELPEDKVKEMEKIAWDTSSSISEDSANQFKNTAEKIKNCWKSCDGLRIDQQASCMLKCTCGEISSSEKPLKLFDPDEIPWLWPIFVIRFCTVPAVDTRFSVWGKRIHSIEEWLKEIYGAVDKLSREWRLWKWTQQYEFLDSSTKQMNVADTLAFTIDIEFVDLADKMPQRSEQFKKKELEKFNTQATQAYGIANPLNNPVTKNSYLVVWYPWEIVSDYMYAANADANRRIISELDKKPEPFVGWVEDSDAQRYHNFKDYVGRFMDQQWTLREETLRYVKDFTAYSEELYAKKCDYQPG